MGLKRLPDRLSALPPRLSAPPKQADPFYLSPEWRAYRSQHRAWTIARQGGVWCCVCGSKHRLILDHRKERKDGGADLPPFEEMDWFCAGHHNAKTARAKAMRARGGG